MDLLLRLGVRKESANKAEFEKLVEDVRGHALTLNLLGTYLRDAHAGDLRKRDLVKLEEADAEEQGGHAFRVMDAYVTSLDSEGKNGKRALAILRLLGLFDRPAGADCTRALLKAPRISSLTESLVGTTDAQRNLAFTRLESAGLLTVNRDASRALVSLDGHPLVRNYFATQLRLRHPGAWRAAHRRLYKHLVATTHEGEHPTLEKLQPLYQAVGHGCLAGMQQEAFDKVYLPRIVRGTEFYSTKKLGAHSSDLGTIAGFFETPWSGVSLGLTEITQAWILNAAAFRLVSLGRLPEALEPMRVAMEIMLDEQDWRNASLGTINLSNLELYLGNAESALKEADKAVSLADRSGSASERWAARVTAGNELYQTGERPAALTRFREAEDILAKDSQSYRLLYGLAGFTYCDVLLSDAECAAWRVIVHGSSQPLPLNVGEIEQRAVETLGWIQGMTGSIGRYEVALGHLTLCRSKLYRAIIQQTSGPAFEQAREKLAIALDGLRRSGEQDKLPYGLLTGSWLRFLEDNVVDSLSDLDEAWEIAERGSMKLFKADIHLYRARLFHGVKPYPWTSPHEDLAAARKLIEQCRYWRRKEELEDAEAAAKNW